ncbi:MAG: hypothetical protein KDA21_08190 [Phycisphaerales bacterium]|nr:hypothetical protein [Phycisphaerales bacterium]
MWIRQAAAAAVSLVIVLLLSVAPASGRPPAQVDAVPAVVVHSSGLDRLLPDERDAALREILALLPARLGELPEQFDDDQEAAAVVRLLTILLTHPFELRLDRDEERTIGMHLWVDRAGNGDPRPLLDELVQAMTGSGPTWDDEGASEYGPAGDERITVRSLNAGRALLTMGPRPADVQITTALPAGIEPVWQVHLDGARFLRREIRDAGGVAGMLALAGVGVDMALGYDEHGSRLGVRVTNASRLQPILGPGQSLTQRDFEVIPADARFAKVAQFDGASMLAWVEQVRGRPLRVIDELSEVAGLDIRKELISQVGPVFATYRAEHLGGGGLMSTVMVGSLRDPARVRDALVEVAGVADKGLAQDSGGFVRVRRWQTEGRRYFSLVTPGIPFPLEVTMTIEDDRLIVGGTPWIVAGAAAQIREHRPSILDAPGIGARLRSAENLTGLLYVDTPATVNAAYGVANAMIAAGHNTVRSPETGRTPDTVPPTWTDFSRDVQPIVALARQQGDIMTIDATGDSSMLVNASALAYAAVSDLQTLLVPVPATVLPALGRARENARQLKAATQVRALVQAAIVYHQAQEQMPESMQVLVDNWFLTEDMLRSPLGPAGDLGPDFALFVDEAWPEEFSAELPVAIDRAAFLNGVDWIPVGFADAHVESLTHEDVSRLLRRHPRVATAFGLDLGEGQGEAAGGPWQRVEAMQSLRTMMMAYMMYAAENTDTFPPSREAVEPYLGPDSLADLSRVSLRWGVGRTAAITMPHRMALGVAVAEGQYVVAFADGHVEAMDHASYAELMKAPYNQDFVPDAR